MYPHTEIELVDNSQYKEIPIAQSSTTNNANNFFIFSPFIYFYIYCSSTNSTSFIE